MTETVEIMINSDHLTNLLWHEDNGDVINLPYLKGVAKRALIKGGNQKIFKYRKIPNEDEIGDKASCRISMEYGAVTRGDRDRTNKYFKSVSMAIYIYVPQTLEDIGNGSRMMCIDKALEDILNGEKIAALTECYVSGSEAMERPPKGYIGRTMYLRFVDTNEGAFNGG